IPIIISSISISASKFGRLKNQSLRVISTYSFIFMFMSVVGMMIATATNPSKYIDIEKSTNLIELQKNAARINRTISEPIEPQIKQTFTQLLRDSIPDNIFESLNESKNIQIVIFSILIGLALNYIPPTHKEEAKKILESVSHIFLKVFNKLKSFFPIALIAYVAKSISHNEHGTFVGLLWLVMIFAISTLVIIIILIWIIKLRSGKNYWVTTRNLLGPVSIAFVTDSTIAAIPSLTHTMIKTFNFNPDIAEFMSSFGLVLFRFGVLIYFSFIAIFIVQFYGINLNIYEYFLIIALSVFATFSTVGASGDVAVAMISLILIPIGVPAGPIILILSFIDNLINPLRMTIDVLANGTAISLVCKKKSLKNRATPA
ncbi:MAG: cation:dicarboxylase symporter family transporter, partial [Alphaproteobacteria bacterium]|nr:cation:dicarboxylase symporter family transporter [Alphaproteobacteria bacterium]